MSLFAGRAGHPFTGTVDAQGIRQWMIDEIAVRTGRDVDTVDTAREFEGYGFDSRAAVEVSGALERILGRRLPPTVLIDHPSVDQLVDHLLVSGHLSAPT